jgi:ribosomal protein S18 acetylase RimI-like enzyme
MAILCNKKLGITEDNMDLLTYYPDTTEVIICYLNSKPIASTIVAKWISSEDQQPNILNVYVQPEHRNIGIGSGLITELLSLGIVDEKTEYNGGNLENLVS